MTPKNIILLPTLALGVAMLGVFTIWIFIKFMKNPKISYHFELTSFLKLLIYSVTIGIIACLLAFEMSMLISPEQIKDCSGSICKIVQINKHEVSQNFGIMFGLATEYIAALAFAMIYGIRR